MLGINFNLSDSQKGYASLIMGVILLLNTLGWFTKWLGGIVMFYAVFLIVYGVLKTHLVKKTMDCISQRNNQPPAQ